jgi:hypothetical protein
LLPILTLNGDQYALKTKANVMSHNTTWRDASGLRVVDVGVSSELTMPFPPEKKEGAARAP